MKMPKKDEYVQFKKFEKKNKKKSSFKIYVDFESILVPEDNGKQYLEHIYKQISKTCCLQ